MTAPTIQPGTRCGCRDAACDCGHEYRATSEAARDERCQREAVRMVTVPVRETYYGALYQVPLCEPCAAWHEAKAGAR
jgi:hypothetical protein